MPLVKGPFIQELNTDLHGTTRIKVWYEIDGELRGAMLALRPECLPVMVSLSHEPWQINVGKED